MPTDHRIPLPQKANAILDDAKMEIGKQQEHLRAIMAGGLTDAEFYRRVGLVIDMTHKTIAIITEAQNVGKKPTEDDGND